MRFVTSRQREALRVIARSLEERDGRGAFSPAGETPGARLMRGELSARILSAAGGLTGAQQELFARRFLREESIEDIAAATGRSRDAVRQSLTVIRRQLRKQLLAAGIDESEARQHVAEFLLGR